MITKSNYYSSFVIGLLTLGAIVSPLVYYRASVIYPFLKISLIFGILLLLIHFVLSINKIWIKKINFSNILFLFFLILFFLFFFRNLNYTNHPFYDHDLLYFGWINEVFTAKYDGPLKWGIAWPYYLAGNHLLPGSIIAVLSTFLQNKNLVTSIEIKYLLVTSTVVFLIFHHIHDTNKNKYFIFIIFILVFFIFREELVYSFTMSQIVVYIIVLEILKQIFNKNESLLELIFLSCLLTICRAHNIFIGLFFLSWFLFNSLPNLKNLKTLYYWKTFYNWRTLLGFFIILATFSSWLIAPKLLRAYEYWSIAHPLYYPSIAQFIDLPKLFPLENITNLMNQFFISPYLLLPIFIYLILKYYLLFFFIIGKLITKNIIKHINYTKSFFIKLKGLEIIILTSLFSWIFLRNGPTDGLYHHLQFFIICTATVIMYVLFIYLININNYKPYFFLIIFAIVYNFPQKAYFKAAPGPFLEIIPVQTSTLNSLSNKEYSNIVVRFFENITDPMMLRDQLINSQQGNTIQYIYNSNDFKDYTIYDNNFYLPKNLESANTSQMKSAILGLRFKLKDVEMLGDSVIRPFLVKNIN